MKNVMHITEVLSGGVLPVIAGICNGLCDRYKFVVIYGLRPDTPDNLRNIFDSRVKLIPLSCLKLKMAIGPDSKAISEIRKCVKDEKPDVIHIHSTKAGIVARIGLLGFDGKKYYTPHGFCFLRNDLSATKKAILRIAETILAKACDGIIACGKNEYDEAKKIYKNVFLVENGLDIDLVDKAVKNVRAVDHKYTVYTAGRIGIQKNPALFNEIAKKLPNIKFIWFGDGKERNLLTSTNIEITGVVNRDDLLKRAVNCDCYLSTSSWEGLPIALLEAMYLGKKCVVTDIEGNNELIINGKTGELFSNADEACSCILGKSYFGQEARTIVSNKYSLSTMCGAYIKIYENKIL